MRTIDDYIDEAKKRSGLKSDRELARVLGFAGNGVTNWRTKRAWPSETHMIQIAKLASVPTAQALLDLHVWSAETPEVRKVYETMRKALTAIAAVLVMVFITNFTLPTKSAVAAAQSNSKESKFPLINYATLRGRNNWRVKQLAATVKSIIVHRIACLIPLRPYPQPFTA